MISLSILGLLAGIGAGLIFIGAFVVCRYSKTKKKTGSDIGQYTLGEAYDSKKHLLETQSVNISTSQEFYIPNEKVNIQPKTPPVTPIGIESLVDVPPSPNTSPTSSSEQGSLFESEIGSVKPDLYARQGTVLQHSVSNPDASALPSELGKLHYKLKYDFDKSDLIVKLVQAKSLPAMDMCGFSDPYVKVCLIPNEDQKLRQTAVHRKTLNPEFRETFKFPVTFEEVQEKTVQFVVYNFDRFSRHDVIGEVKIQITNIDITQEVEIWSDLQPKPEGMETLGELLFSLSYLPTAERLTVVVMKARNLKALDVGGQSDPYAKVTLIQGGKKLKKKKTTVKKNERHPVWNEALIFNVPLSQLKTTSLCLTIIDNDLLGHGAEIGSCEVGLDCKSETGHSHWRDMTMNQRKPIAMWHNLQRKQTT